MAHELGYSGDPQTESGLTVTATVYTAAGSIVQAEIACVEINATAIYLGTMPTTGAGTYIVKFFAGQTYLSTGIMLWDGSAEITPPSAAQIANAIYETAWAAHTDPLTFGGKINAAGNAGDPWALLQSVMATYPAGSAAKILLRLAEIQPTDRPLLPYPAPPLAANECLCILDTEDGSSVTHADVKFEFTLSAYPVVADRAILTDKITAVTDATGRLQVILTRTDAMTPAGTTWIVNAPRLGIKKKPMELTTAVFSMTDWLKA